MATPTSQNGAIDTSKIAGNGSDEIKQLLGDIGEFFHSRRAPGMTTSGFGEAIQKRLRLTEISFNKKAEEERKMEARVVMETEVHEDMLNGGGNIHGGCSAFLVDTCSSLALLAMVKETQGVLVATVSQSLNLVYHSPAQLGDTLRIVNTTLTVGARAHSVRTEIWNVTHHRLVVSGTHVKMVPSLPKPKSNL
ncbi:Acyl-coenzyme A thioesterase 13 [Psilocybe cubensis]|uniref:Thioesterase domain-containing protein n=2 Tax=Psilocybe cubensis TaxID=181762 RepID=A0A8H8CL64_PSICU|nr:Acyl-coenzyme A thioesterase 13 [Psilocybe cubensis]KAH9482185.1 Acyl-coenzyme A thioesterase 13 [Psilocybe cubensis]